MYLLVTISTFSLPPDVLVYNIVCVVGASKEWSEESCPKNTYGTDAVRDKNLVMGKTLQMRLTYKPPVKKRPSRASFCRKGTCRFQNIAIGSRSMAKSETMFIVLVA